MRQAGRYLPEYRALKERFGFAEMTRRPEIAAEITLQPIRRFAFDAAIIFSDIMTPLEAFGIKIDFSPGPVIASPLRSPEAIENLTPTEQIAPYVGTALRLVRAELPSSVALIGFCGAPLTLAAYLIEGSGSKDYEHFRRFLRTEPSSVHVLLDKLTDLCIEYLKMQIACGAQAVQLFDTGAGLHGLSAYKEFAIPYNARILEALTGSGAARIYFALGGAHLLDAIAEVPAEVVGIDWRTDLKQARRKLGSRTLQGNLDPAALFADRSALATEVRNVLESGADGPHIFNLGHGIWPGTPLEAVAEVIEIVHSWARP